MLTSLFKTIPTPTDIGVVHNASIDVLDPEQVVTKAFAQGSTVLQEDYKAPTGFTGVVQTLLSSIARGKPAFPSSSDRTFYLEFLDGGNTEIQVSVADDAPPCIPTFIGVHGMAGDLEAPYLHEILKPLASELGGRLVVFNLRGCGASTATSPAFHHGGSTSDLGAVISWVTMKWPESKIYLIGTSLGGVISAKTLGQWGEDCPVSAAALVSPVYDFQASCKAMETAFVARTVFNPAVGSYYARLVKKNIAAFNDLEHWAQTRPKPFAASPSNPPTSISPPPSPIDSIISRPFCRDSRTSSFDSTPSRGTTTRSNSLFSTLPTPSTPGTSLPPTPSADSAFCFPPATAPTLPPSPLVEHTEEIKEALAKALWKITDQRRLRAQTLTRFCKSFVAATAHFSSWDEFLRETSAVNDLPNIRVPTLAINCADDPLMPGKDLPRVQALQSPYFVMVVPKKGGHLGTFTTRKWKKKYGDMKYHTALVKEWFTAQEELMLLRPRPRMLQANQGFVYPEGHPEMAFRETTVAWLKIKFAKPVYPKSKST